MDILSLAKANFAETVAHRRYLHAHPETGPEEQTETMAYIMRELEKLEIPCVQVPGGGIFATIDGPVEGKTLLLRADMDGLPIQEDPNNLAGPKVCVSQTPGVMHGCGHDAHTAMLLTEAKLLKQLQPELKGRILLMFEEGEEGHPNIEQMCLHLHRTGTQIDGCYAAHVRWDLPVGKVACREGATMSGLYHFSVRLFGKPGHGSRPDLASSPIDCFHQLYTAMQTLRMKTVRPDTSLTWSIGQLRAGERFNDIPDELEFRGSIRFLDRESGAAFWSAMHTALDHVCAMCGCTYILRRLQYLLPVTNFAPSVRLCREAVAEALGPDHLTDCDPWMASESYSYLCSMIPSVYAFVGIRNEALGSGANHHTPQFDIDEEAMLYGVTAAVSYAVRFLEAPPETAGFTPLFSSLAEIVERLCDRQEGTAL